MPTPVEDHLEIMISLGFLISILIQLSYQTKSILFIIVNSERVVVLGQEMMEMVYLKPNGNRQEISVLEDTPKDLLILMLEVAGPTMVALLGTGFIFLGTPRTNTSS